jgi:hypothetical protein
MPIKGLTDRDSIQPRFPRIGKLRKGDEKVSDRKPGAELNYWRFTSDRDGAVEAFAAVFGSQPQRVQVYLPYAGVEENFQTWKEEWGAGSLKHRCDGETCTIWLGEDGRYHQEPKPCPGGCKEVGRLELIIPELFQAGHVGTVTMETHSLNDLISITETLMKTAELRGDNPLGLRGILFNLRRVPEQISVPGFGANAGKRQRVEKWLVKIEPAVDWVQAQMALARSEGDARELEAQARPALTVEGEIVEHDDPGPDFEDGSEPEPAVASVPENKPPHWIEDEATRKRFWAWAEDSGLSNSDVHKALGVEHVRDFDGDKAAAVAAIHAWIAGQAGA